MMSKIIKAAQLKINQIDEEPRLGLALVGKSLVAQYRGPQNFSQAEVRATYLSREISLSVIKRVPNWLGATLSSLWLLRSSTSTFLSSLSSPMKELSLDCQVYGLAGEPIITSHTVAYNYIERQELSLVNIFSPQTAYKLNHYHALLLLGLRFASAQYIIFLISLFFNPSVRELFFNLQLSNPLVKELLLLVGLSDLLVRELFDNQKIDEGNNNIAVGDKSSFQDQLYFSTYRKHFTKVVETSFYQCLFLTSLVKEKTILGYCPQDSDKNFHSLGTLTLAAKIVQNVISTVNTLLGKFYVTLIWTDIKAKYKTYNNE